MALSSSGQDGALSRLKLGFESRQGHAFLPNEKTPPGPPRAMPFFLPTHPPSSDKSPSCPIVTADDGPSWTSLGAATAAVSAEIHRASTGSRFQPLRM